MFRDDFVWGVGTSSYQFEGDRDDVPRGLCIWDTYIEENKARTSGHDAKVACDHIHKYKELRITDSQLTGAEFFLMEPVRLI